MALPVSTPEAWAAMRLPAVVVPAAIGAGLAAEVRGRLESAEYTRYARIDRASYDALERVDEPALLDALLTLAVSVTGRDLAVRSARAMRLCPGDYVLVRHDRVHEDRPVEIVLDLSTERVAGADVHYRHRGQLFFTAPSAPGSLSIVERGPTILCNHTYVSRRPPASSVLRLVALLG
jgi:hypothetical protein